MKMVRLALLKGIVMLYLYGVFEPSGASGADTTLPVEPPHATTASTSAGDEDDDSIPIIVNNYQTVVSESTPPAAMAQHYFLSSTNNNGQQQQQQTTPSPTATTLIAAAPSIEPPTEDAGAAEASSPPTHTTAEPVRHSFGRGFPLPHYHHLPDSSRGGPFFEEGNEPHNITARVGSTVLIDCRIGLLQNKTVTWLHHKGDSIHLLTVGRSAYSSDDRITLSLRYPNNFRLQIDYITRRDEGLYECQVATHPPKVKRIFLKVTAPEVRIVDESGRSVTERYYKAGSALELTCLATQVGGPPSAEDPPITWRHGDRTLSKGISSNMSEPTDSAISTLMVTPLERRHSGNYTCAVGALAFATVAVHVLNGELPAAVHHGNAAPSGILSHPLMLFMLIICLLVHHR